VKRCRANDFDSNDEPCKAIFWLDPARSHDVFLMEKVQQHLARLNVSDLDIEILSPREAARVTCQRAKDGLNTISVTGNVLHDYLTDLFATMELGTPAKLLSIVPLLGGGALYETGAGGSAPKHVDQFLKEGHLRWDSLGEYLALACALEEIGEHSTKAKVMGDALRNAIHTFLQNNKNPSRTGREIDNRGSHYWLARYWAEELADQSQDKQLRKVFSVTSGELAANEGKILQDLLDCQGQPMQLGGYYKMDKVKVDKAMNPSENLGAIIGRLIQALAEKSD